MVNVLKIAAVGAVLAVVLLSVGSCTAPIASQPPESATPAAESGTLPLKCLRQDLARAILRRQFAQRVIGAGVAGSTGHAELYVGRDRDWTMVITITEGYTCLLAAGSNWHAVADGSI